MRGLRIDTVVDGRYQVVGHLGTGGMAEVYCATDLQLGRKVALKVLHERFAADEQFVERFKREASAAAGLQHQHLVAVYDRGEWNGTSYIAMEYVAGRTLKQIVADEGPLEPTRAVDLTIQILRAARFAHRRGIVHRDFKPQNVIVDDEGRAKVTDFGIARAGASDMTQTGSIMGTAQYLSPEQAQGHAVTARSDLYSIGVVLYELLTGRVPFEADSPVTIALKQVNEAPVAPRALNPAVTPGLEHAVMRALAKDPANRFADADEFIAALQAAASRIPSPAQVAAAEAAAAALPLHARPPAPPPPPQATSVLEPVAPAAAPPPYQPSAAGSGRAPRRWGWLLVGALVFMAALLGLVSALTPTQVRVPDVAGSSISVATQRLQSAGFEVQTVRDSSDQPRGTVIGQDPAAGATVDKGARVTLTVSEGPAIKEVPDVVDKGWRTATRILEDAGFEVRPVKVPSDDVKVDHVVAQSPDGGAIAEHGSTIRIEVSTGPERLDVPDVVGKTADEARTALDEFRVVVTDREDEQAEPGTVLSQDPKDGTLPRGATVRLAVAIEPRQVAVPDVVGSTQNDATTTLSKAGFEVVVEEVAVPSADQDGHVVEQDPPASAGKIDRGAKVTITVGRFDASTGTQPGSETTPTAAAPGPT